MKRLFYILLLPLIVGCQFDPTGFFFTSDRVNQRFDESMAYNAAQPAHEIETTDNEYQILFASDGHVCDTGNLSKLIVTANQLNTEALFFTGDIVQGKENDYRTLYDVMDRSFGSPYFMSVGNHELYYNGWPYYAHYYGSSVYTVAIKTPDYSDLVIVLDSGSGTLGSNQLAWLRDILENQRSNYRYCIVVHHVNIFRTRFSTVASPVVEEVHELVDLFTVNHVDMVVMGHDHRRIIDEFGGTSYICIEAFADFMESPACMLVTAGSDELQYEFIGL